jgi:hypothetical protein
MKQAILSNWNIMRFLRLVIGISIIVQAIMAKDLMFGFIGLLFSGMALFNIGSCGSGGCYVPAKATTETKKDIGYEEVV